MGFNAHTLCMDVDDSPSVIAETPTGSASDIDYGGSEHELHEADTTFRADVENLVGPDARGNEGEREEQDRGLQEAIKAEGDQADGEVETDRMEQDIAQQDIDGGSFAIMAGAAQDIELDAEADDQKVSQSATPALDTALSTSDRGDAPSPSVSNPLKASTRPTGKRKLAQDSP